jgi:ElaB/YqjD/DUF883 family membrane-anchored ribosome-binding protein
LVADADDLLSALENSTSPEIRALKLKVESSMADMKTRFRERAKRSFAAGQDWKRSLKHGIGSRPWISAALASAALGVLYFTFIRRDEGR